jgi:hypothetical protein
MRVSDLSIPTAGAAPQDHDIVVTRESMSAVRYTMRQLPGVVQISASTRDEAVRLARSFAQKQAVDIWYAENGTYRLLEAYRSRPGQRSVRDADIA